MKVFLALKNADLQFKEMNDHFIYIYFEKI